MVSIRVPRVQNPWRPESGWLSSRVRGGGGGDVDEDGQLVFVLVVDADEIDETSLWPRVGGRGPLTPR